MAKRLWKPPINRVRPERGRLHQKPAEELIVPEGIADADNSPTPITVSKELAQHLGLPSRRYDLDALAFGAAFAVDQETAQRLGPAYFKIIELLEDAFARVSESDGKSTLAQALIDGFLAKKISERHDSLRLNVNATRLRELLDEAAALITSDPALVAVFKQHALSGTGAGSPTAAPQLWKKRHGETALQFLTNVYADWLPDRITLANIRQIDRKLYNALIMWRLRNPDSVPPALTPFFGETQIKRRQKTEKELKALKVKKPIDAYKKAPNQREADRLYSAALRLKK